MITRISFGKGGIEMEAKCRPKCPATQVDYSCYYTICLLDPW